MDNLRRATSNGSTAHTHSSHNHHNGGYPVPPMPVHTTEYPPDDYGGYNIQPSQYRGPASHAPQQQQVQRQVYNYPPLRVPNAMYEPQSRKSVPQLSGISPFDDVNPILPTTVTAVATRRSSLLNSAPPSPSPSSDYTRRRLSSHSRLLDPGMSEMPVAPPLPATFGSDQDDERPYSGVDDDFVHDHFPRALKVSQL